ncbi:MAG: Pilus assembly protein PilE [uncultured Thiotrichaceae bacterium]|uniref:Pilus assembly protein PilE n=1 Tax=uncultured Thiotrichaceae bacterium TaxID=298394 RepID=A0A6S6SS32_9GAMM|nr:MAG: Pilus assembly protein PilE [uncultured Thiotrichaceae bacterium]
MFIKRQQQGFTLIEIMIVVAIIGIISAVAYPSYLAQVQQSRRSDAQVGLQQLAQRQEAYFSRSYSYASTLEQLGYGNVTSIDSPEGMYLHSISATSPSACDGTATASCTSFTVSAVPKAGNSQASDNDCATFTLDNVGRKSAENNDSTPAGTTEICW